MSGLSRSCLQTGLHVDPFRAAHRRYAVLRTLAYENALEEARAYAASGAVREALGRRLLEGDPRVTGLDQTAHAAWDATWRDRRHWTGAGGWPWDRTAQRFCQRPQAFHLAIWSGERLCGLAAGRPSRRTRIGHRHTLSVHYLESDPDETHPLRGWIAPLAIACATSYGHLLGATRLALVNPLPGALTLYQARGFTVAYRANQPVSCWKRI